jgi:4-hydroxybenzoate polyprenyltransferase
MPSLLPFCQLMRLHQNTGIFLLLWPCFWALLLTNSPFFYYPLFALGAVVMRAAGCVINDLWDRKFDAKVERTRNRPLASGALQPHHALILLGVLLLIGLLILLQLPTLSILIGVATLLPVTLYPLMKRVTFYPQIMLGLTFNGTLIAYSAGAGALNATAFWLYAATALWALGYDTIYAVQDTQDDRMIGVKSTALIWEGRLPQAIALIYGLCVLCLAAALFTQSVGVFAWAGLGCFAAHLAWQNIRLRRMDATQAGAVFRSNRIAGGILGLALLLDRLF